MTRATAHNSAFEKIRLRFLSAGLLGQVDGVASVLGLVSRQRGEGVTTICIGLAQAVAASGSRVLLIDACRVGKEAKTLLGHDRAPLSSRTWTKQGFALAAEVVRPRDQAYDMLVVADLAPAGPEWTASWPELGTRYDVVVIDAGSLEHEAAHTWGAFAGRVILVMDTERATYEILDRFRVDLDRSPLQFSGFVMNKRNFPIPRALYRFAT